MVTKIHIFSYVLHSCSSLISGLRRLCVLQVTQRQPFKRRNLGALGECFWQRNEHLLMYIQCWLKQLHWGILFWHAGGWQQGTVLLSTVFCTPFFPSHLQGILSIHSLRAAPLYWKELIFSPLFCSSLTPFPICSVLRAITIWNGVCWWASLQRQGQKSIPPDPLPRHSSPTPLSGMLQQISTLRFSLYCCWPIPYTANISTWVPDTAVLTSFWTSLLRSAQACFADVPRVIMSSQND